MSRSIRLLLPLLLLFLSSGSASAQNRCDIEEIYEIDRDVPSVKVLTDDGEIEELNDVVEALLTPVKFDEGVYEMVVTRKDSDLYEVQGKNYLIQTRYCHEYSYSDEVILRYKSSYGYTKGELIFD